MKFITTVRLFVKNDREPQSRRKHITKIRQGSRRDRLYSSDRFVLHDSLFTHDHRFSHSSFSSSFARSSFIPPTICLRAVRNRRWITLTNVPWNFIVKKGKKKVNLPSLSCANHRSPFTFASRLKQPVFINLEHVESPSSSSSFSSVHDYKFALPIVSTVYLCPRNKDTRRNRRLRVTIIIIIAL